MSLNEEECGIVKQALRTYVSELEKAKKAEEKVGVPSTEVNARLATIYGMDGTESLIAKFEEQEDLFPSTV